MCDDDKGDKAWSPTGPLQMEPSCPVQHGPCGGIFGGSCNAVLQLLGRFVRCVSEKNDLSLASFRGDCSKLATFCTLQKMKLEICHVQTYFADFIIL